MTEWQIIESDDFSDLPNVQEAGSARAPSGGWRSAKWRSIVLVLILLFLFGGGGYWFLTEQLSMGRAAIRADLNAVIFEEETQQYLGHTEQAVDFVMPTAPRYWQDIYRQTFTGDKPRPRPIQLKTVDFDGRCAVVEMTVAGAERIRAYCLTGDRWRRAPVSANAWGETEVVEINDNLRLIFRERDQIFGQGLTNELKQFYQELDQWTLGQPQTDAEADEETRLTVIIEPQELGPVLVVDEARRIVINSPKVALVQGPFPTEIAVRLALREALIRRTLPVEAGFDGFLPGANHLLRAVPSVVAMQTVLSSEAQTKLLESWYDQLKGDWISPFLVTNNRDFVQKAEITALITVDHIARTHGLKAVGNLMDQLSQADSWDQLFQTTLDYATVELEAETIARLQQNLHPASIRAPLDYLGTFPTFPIQATILRMASGPTGGHRAFVGVPDRMKPLVVEIPAGVGARTTAQIALPAGCLPPDSAVAIDGAWLEAPRRLAANDLIAHQIAPVTVRTAPTDTVAYIVEDELSDEQRTELNDILLSSQANPTPLKPPASRWLFAVRQNGSIRRLVALNQNTRVFSLATAAGQPLRLLFIFGLPTCNRSWFVLYDPQQGSTEQWLAPPDPLQWIWRPDRQDILFFVPRGGGRGFEIYKTGPPMGLDPVSRTFAPLVFLGWNTALERPINALDWFDTTYIGATNLTTGGLDRVRAYFQPIRAPRLSSTGEWLAYLAGHENPLAPANRLGLLQIKAKNDVTVLQLEARQGLAFPTWSTYVDQTSLAVLTGSVIEDHTLRPTQLLLIQPEASPSPILIAQAGDNEQLGAPIFCANGDLLYRVERDNHNLLLRQKPGLPAQILLKRSQVFRPLACS